MKGKPTYTCQECGYVVRVSSEYELDEERKKHRLICDKELIHITDSQGDCIRTAIINCRQNPGYMFCYSKLPGRISGQSFIHAWNEINGIVIDQANNMNIIVQKNIYYTAKRISEIDVTKMDLHEVEKRINRALKKGRDAYSWIQ